MLRPKLVVRAAIDELFAVGFEGSVPPKDKPPNETIRGDPEEKKSDDSGSTVALSSVSCRTSHSRLEKQGYLVSNPLICGRGTLFSTHRVHGAHHALYLIAWCFVFFCIHPSLVLLIWFTMLYMFPPVYVEGGRTIYPSHVWARLAKRVRRHSGRLSSSQGAFLVTYH